MEKLKLEETSPSRSSKTNIIRAKFEFAGYPNDSSLEYFEAILDTVRQMGFDPKEVIFTGIHDVGSKKTDVFLPHRTIYGMNEAAWRQIIKVPDSLAAATYAHQGDNPRLVLYDRKQLATAASTDLSIGSEGEDIIHHYDSGERMLHSNITKLDDLADMSPDEPVSETLIHKDDPSKTPRDAVLGIIELLN